ncbi:MULTISPECIES: hybrid sensor histidine kinase/response regulator [Haloarcula]|uniref:hybrid sensor histidine kinase/response regulator n=1 Tax=Haloarcula TaxID=2237 RepID=UPI0023E79456|nr:hybrid sensor histidine kinase/response regulator [Halomicroarcula sp. SHR3]
MTDEHTILLVEDNPSDARLIEEFLKEQTQTFTVRHVDRLAEATEARDDTVDIILLDLDLPDSGGFETLETMLDVAGTEPVVVLTGLDEDGVGVEAVERGAQDFLIKTDLGPKLLGQTIRYAIERARQQEELEQRNRELALLNQIVRHDIKNDLTVILGWGVALREHVEPAGEDHLDRIMRASEHIEAIADTAGDFMEILDGEEQPELHPISLPSVLETEVAKANSAHADATITVPESLLPGLQVTATDLLSSVFRNLLNNAVIHNDKAEPHVSVEVETDADRVAVHVCDNGPGIPDSQKSSVFGQGAMGEQSHGSGIGLYLVDTLVAMYDGTVQIRDRSDWAGEPNLDGSVFSVTLRRV